MDIMARIQQQIESNPIILYMKGTPDFPQCGFSSQTVQALMETGARFAYVNVLEEPDIRQHLPRYADWPTFPQLFVNGELIGGCDIVLDMYQNGELQQLIDSVNSESQV